MITTDDYLELLCKEIRSRESMIPHRQLHSIYFGGGTPSLMRPHQIVTILEALDNVGFIRDEHTEITLEINPGTLSKDDFVRLKSMGVNRFSLGGQTFDDQLLRVCRREHSSYSTRKDLETLGSLDLNYSFDILFGLPGQNLKSVDNDLSILLPYEPPHVSTYCLTIPEGHPLQLGRAKDDEQSEMYDLIEDRLKSEEIYRYEISNFAKESARSKHNQIYWNDQPYWGLGISAHSYEPKDGWGVRYWNPKTVSQWRQQLLTSPQGSLYNFLPEPQVERLAPHEAMTDFCHTQLRKSTGMAKNMLRYKWPDPFSKLIEARLEALIQRGWVQYEDSSWSLTTEGQVLSNQAFSALTFLSSDLTRERMNPYFQ